MPEFAKPTILMCPPDHYGIEYEINPWMDKTKGADHARAQSQWQALHDTLVSLGVDVRLMTAVKGLPDLVFTANAGLIWRSTAFVATFRHGARQGETPVDEAWFRDCGFRTVLPPETMDLEGAGDALFCGDTLFGGYLIRSDARALQWVGERIGCRVIPLQLVNDYYYHLDTCFCPLKPDQALYYPGAFDRYGLQALEDAIDELIPVEEEEAARFACNAVVVGKDVVLNTGCPRLEATLRERGYTPHPTDLSEYIKSGGSAKCLTLRLDGEDAAEWP